MLQNYTDKNILLTGTTGFLGKVILEKMLRTIPHFNKLYILIRAQKKKTPQERFQEVLDCPLFQKLKQIKGDQFQSFIQSKCHVIQGDLLQKKSGLSNEDHQMLTENLHIIMNCAASVDFTSPLIDHIHSNVLGTIEMYELAEQCKHIENFIHVSTAYVNSNKIGVIEEKIYEEGNEDPEQMIMRLKNMDPKILQAKTKQIIGNFPNCYTFTKAAAERIIQNRRRKDLTVTIVRPSIIGSMNMDDPYKGWVEGFTSCTAAFCLIGIGLIRHSPTPPATIGDLIPVNYISDYVIVVGNYIQNTQKLHVCHSTSSASQIPCIWDFTNQVVREYWSVNKSKKAIGKPVVTQHNSLLVNKAMIYLTQEVPVKFFTKYADITKNKPMQKQAKQLNKALKNVLMIHDLFGPLASKTWIYQAPFVQNLLQLMTKEEKQVFNIDSETIDWFDFLLHYQYGIQRFILKEDRKPPAVVDFITPQNEWYFNQLRWAYKNWENIEAYKKNQDSSQKEVQQQNQKKLQYNNNFRIQQSNISSAPNLQQGIQYFSKL